MRRPLKIALGIGIAVALTVAGFVVLLGQEEIQRGTHLARVDWLPPEASDVTYAKRDGFGWFTCYECKMPREAFDRLAERAGWSPVPKNDVSTGLRLTLGQTGQTKPADKGGVITVDLNSDLGLPIVRKALFYEKRQSNGGGVTVVYDLDSGRLFVHESNR